MIFLELEESFFLLPLKSLYQLPLTEASYFFCNLKLLSLLPDKPVEQTNHHATTDDVTNGYRN